MHWSLPRFGQFTCFHWNLSTLLNILSLSGSRMVLEQPHIRNIGKLQRLRLRLWLAWINSDVSHVILMRRPFIWAFFRDSEYYHIGGKAAVSSRGLKTFLPRQTTSCGISPASWSVLFKPILYCWTSNCRHVMTFSWTTQFPREEMPTNYTIRGELNCRKYP